MDAPVAPTLTEKSVPCPGVEVYFPTLDAAAVRITVWRIADGVREAVRGAEGASVSGDFVVTDWEAPFGVVATYVGEIFDTDGASITGSQSSIQIDRNEVWFQDQVDPELSLPIYLDPTTRQALTRGAAETIRRTRSTSKQFVFGRSRPFLQNFGLGPIESLPMGSYTESESAMQTMLELLQVSPLTVRTPPLFASLPRVLSVDIASPEARPVRQDKGGYRHLWLLTLDEVAPVAKAIIKPLVTWSDWETAFPADEFTWDDVILIYSAGTWTDAVRNPPA